MKNIILNLAVSLDGFIEGPQGEIDWCILDEEMDFEAFLNSVDTLFYGRISYDLWGNYQPGDDGDAAEKKLWAEIHTKQKYVFSRQHRVDENAVFITSDILRQVTELKAQPGKDIWLYGGADLVKTFIHHNLIDVYKISIHPVALGGGKPLFEALEKRVNLRLLDTRVFRSGVVELTYEPVRLS